MSEDALTQIQIKVKTRERLKGFKLTNRESYEEILTRFMDKLEEIGYKPTPAVVKA